MIPSNAPLPQLQAYAKVAEPTPVQVVDIIQGLEQLFTVGEQVRALVTNQLPTGRFAVLVKDQLLDLNLPRNTEEGQTVDMQVLATSPRLTFLLTKGASESAASLPTPQTAAEPTGPGTGNVVSLSDTARFLGNLLSEQGESSTAGKATAAAGQAISETTNLPPAAQIAARLADVLSQTGMFYESHLAEWATGARTLQQIAAEPQAGLPVAAEEVAESAVELPANPAQSATGRPDAAQSQVATKDQQVGNAQLATTIQEQSRASLSALAQEAKPGNSQTASSLLDTMPAAARQIVQQQLQVLEQRQVAWHGQAWPGQAMKWEVEQDGRRQANGEADPQGTWWTRLQLDLPKLGRVDAVVSLTNRMQVDVRFQVCDPTTAQKILTEQDRLQVQLESAGLKLVGNQVTLAADDQDAATGLASAPA